MVEVFCALKLLVTCMVNTRGLNLRMRGKNGDCLCLGARCLSPQVKRGWLMGIERSWIGNAGNASSGNALCVCGSVHAACTHHNLAAFARSPGAREYRQHCSWQYILKRS